MDMSPEGNRQFYTNVLRAGSVEIGQRRDRRDESALILKWAERGGKILEIGSNLGYFTGQVAKETGSHVVGIDTNTSKWLYKIARLRNKGNSVSFVQGQNFATTVNRNTGQLSRTGLTFKDGSFDQAIMSHVIEHFEDPTELINEIKRVLKDNGTLIVAVPREKILGENTKDHKVLYESVEQLRSQLEGYGFELVDEKDFGLRESAVVKMRKKTKVD